MFFSRNTNELQLPAKPSKLTSVADHPLAYRPNSDRTLYHPISSPALLTLNGFDGVQPEVGYFETSAGHRLRKAEFKPQHGNDVVVTNVLGKNATLGCSARLCTALAKKGYYASPFEPASQGGSTRFLANPHKIHAKDGFQIHRSNLREVVAENRKNGALHIVVAESFGAGYIIPELDSLEVDGFVALAPLVEACQAPLKDRTCRAYARLMTRLGRSEEFIRGGRPHLSHYENNNTYTNHLPSLREVEMDFMPGSPLATGDATIGWLLSYQENGDAILAKPTGSIKTPTHFVLADGDETVNNSLTCTASRAFADCRISQVEAWHALTLGGPAVIDRIVAEVDMLCRNLRHMRSFVGYRHS